MINTTTLSIVDSMCKIEANACYLLGVLTIVLCIDSGEDFPATLTSRMNNYCKRIEWIKANGAALSAIIIDSYVAAGISLDSS